MHNTEEGELITYLEKTIVESRTLEKQTVWIICSPGI